MASDKPAPSAPVWVIKAGSHGDEEDPEYLHKWTIGAHCERKDPEWVGRQTLAFRFTDRNAAAEIANSFPICAYSDDVRIVRLVPPPIVRTISKQSSDDGGGAKHECG